MKDPFFLCLAFSIMQQYDLRPEPVMSMQFCRRMLSVDDFLRVSKECSLHKLSRMCVKLYFCNERAQLFDILTMVCM